MKNQIFETKFKINITESNINIVNYNKIIEINDNNIIIEYNNKLLKIYGNNLTIKKMIDDEILIQGDITSINL